MDRLIRAYPAFLRASDGDAVRLPDNTLLPWDDGPNNKTFQQKLDHASLADQMSIPYVAGPMTSPPAANQDPGRFRNLAFFRKMYGGDESAVRRNLVPVTWNIGTYKGEMPFTAVNGVDKAIAAVVAELARLPADLHKFLVPPSGSFNWRAIAGTGELSPHAFGIAVDINSDLSDYWRWEPSLAWKSRIPFEIVDIFERHHFIWGGKWYHFDTMHFEYRPELV